MQIQQQQGSNIQGQVQGPSEPSQNPQQIVIGSNQQMQIQQQQGSNIQGQVQGPSEPSQNPQQIVIINQQQGAGQPTQQKFKILPQQINPNLVQKPQQNTVSTSMAGNKIVQQKLTNQGNLNSGGNLQQTIQMAADGSMDPQQKVNV